MSVFGGQTSNPAMKAFRSHDEHANPFSTAAQTAGPAAAIESRPGVMTIGGTVNATFILLGITVASAVMGWTLVPKLSEGLGLGLLIFGSLGGVVASLIMMFRPRTAPIVAPIFAVGDGLFTGLVSFLYAKMAAGTKLGGVTGTNIVFMAMGVTFAILAGMLLLYKFRIIQATRTFKKVMMVAGVGIGLFAIASLIAWACGLRLVDFNSPLAMVITAGVAVYASFCLILDFDFVEQGAATGQPKYMEWYGGFSIMFTLVWIYLEVLKLLAMLSRRD